MADRTIVYVDGFNLYYLALRSTIYKWLDLYKLAETLLPAEYHDIVKVKFFTARINALPNDPDAPNRQNVYLKALKAYRPGKIEIIYGKFLSHPAWRPYAPPNSGYANVVLTEEKGTDVNLAVHLLNDAWMNEFDCAVVVSNDSDLAEAMRLAKARNKKIGWMIPKTEHPSQELKSIPHFKKKSAPQPLPIRSSRIRYPAPISSSRRRGTSAKNKPGGTHRISTADSPHATIPFRWFNGNDQRAATFPICALRRVFFYAVFPGFFGKRLDFFPPEAYSIWQTFPARRHPPRERPGNALLRQQGFTLPFSLLSHFF